MFEPRPKKISTLCGPVDTFPSQANPGRRHVRRYGRSELANRHRDRLNGSDLEDPCSDRLGERFEQAVLALVDDLHGLFHDERVVDRLGQLVIVSCLTEVGLYLKIDLERLRIVLLALEGTMAPEYPKPP